MLINHFQATSALAKCFHASLDVVPLFDPADKVQSVTKWSNKINQLAFMNGMMVCVFIMHSYDYVNSLKLGIKD